jgi:hypothetical protein
VARTAGNLLPPASATSLLPLASCHQPLPPASATSLAPRGTRTAYTADTAPHAPPPPTEAAAACAEENQPSLLSTDTPDDHTSSTGLSKLHAPPPLTPHHTAPHRTTPPTPPHHHHTTPPALPRRVSDEGETRNLNPECSLLQRSACADAIPSADEIRLGGPPLDTLHTPHALHALQAPHSPHARHALHAEMRNTTWSVFSRPPMSSSLTTSDPAARDAHATSHTPCAMPARTPAQPSRVSLCRPSRLIQPPDALYLSLQALGQVDRSRCAGMTAASRYAPQPPPPTHTPHHTHHAHTTPRTPHTGRAHGVEEMCSRRSTYFWPSHIC